MLLVDRTPTPGTLDGDFGDDVPVRCRRFLLPEEPRKDPLSSKADFTDVYNATDPRGYYSSMGELDYQIPSHGTPVFRRLAEALGAEGPAPTVLDVCCSYGVNAVLLNHDLTLDEVHDHYTSPHTADLSREELVAADRALFAEHRRPDALEVIGLDASTNAVAYAVDAGLLDHGLDVDLEADQSATELASVSSRLATADLVTVTGGVGYIKERTFEHIAAAGGDDPPWIAALSLRWVDFDPIADCLEKYGLVTERLDGYLAPQRRFADDEERRFVFESLDAGGVEPTDVELDGWHCAELFLTRPEDATEEPIETLLDVADLSQVS